MHAHVPPRTHECVIQPKPCCMHSLPGKVALGVWVGSRAACIDSHTHTHCLLSHPPVTPACWPPALGLRASGAADTEGSSTASKQPPLPVHSRTGKRAYAHARKHTHTHAHTHTHQATRARACAAHMTAGQAAAAHLHALRGRGQHGHERVDHHPALGVVRWQVAG